MDDGWGRSEKATLTGHQRRVLESGMVNVTQTSYFFCGTVGNTDLIINSENPFSPLRYNRTNLTTRQSTLTYKS